jgi:hypothetical protein
MRDQASIIYGPLRRKIPRLALAVYWTRPSVYESTPAALLPSGIIQSRSNRNEKKKTRWITRVFVRLDPLFLFRRAAPEVTDRLYLVRAHDFGIGGQKARKPSTQKNSTQDWMHGWNGTCFVPAKKLLLLFPVSSPSLAPTVVARPGRDMTRSMHPRRRPLHLSILLGPPTTWPSASTPMTEETTRDSIICLAAMQERKKYGRCRGCLWYPCVDQIFPSSAQGGRVSLTDAAATTKIKV